MRVRLAFGTIAVVVAAVAVVASPVSAGAARAVPASHAQAAHAAPASRAPVRATPITPNGAWTVYHHDNAHTGFDSTQPTAKSASTGWTSGIFDDRVYGEPVVYQGVVYAATLSNTVYALNQTDGSLIWSKNLGAPTTGGWICGNVSPQGILGTPVIDQSSNRIYVAALLSSHVYWVFGLDLANLGTVVLQTPLTSTGNANFASFDWTIQQERGALAVANGYVYVPFGGRAGDCYHNGVPYHGWVAGVPTNGSAAFNLFQTGGVENGIWSGGGVVVDDSTGKLFVTTGNGGCPSTYNYNDAVIRLSATLALEDYFAPQDWKNNWSCNDEDLGSASTVLINPNLAWQGGKWGNGFLVNPKNLGGIDGQLFPTPSPQTYAPVDVCLGNHHDANFGSYAYSAPYVYVSCDANSQIGFTGRLVALKVDTVANTFSPCDSTCAAPSWAAGSRTFGPPIVAGGAVWVVDTGGGGLYGFDAATGAQIYHSAGFGATHFTTPSEAGGQIFVASDTVVREFDMAIGCRSVSLVANPPSSASVGSSPVFTAGAAGCPNPSPSYQFWTLAPGAASWQLAQPYSTTNTFTWNTTGNIVGGYQVAVWARDAMSAGDFGNSFGRWDAVSFIPYTLVAPTCTGLTLGAAPPGMTSVGSSPTFTATGTCPDANPVYQFFTLSPGAGSWTVGQAFSTSNTFNWSTTGKTPGTWQVAAWVRDASSGGVYSNSFGNFDLSTAVAYTLTTCSGLTLAAMPASPAGVGGSPTFTASATGCPHASPVYQFFTLAPGAGSWTIAQAFSATNTFSWSTTGKTPSGWQVAVWVRDASSGGVYSNSFGTFDLSTAVAYTLTTCSGVSLGASPSSSAPVGTSVTFTANAIGCPNPSPVYQFWVLAPGASSWTIAQAYSTSSTFIWNTTGKAKGNYQVAVWVRDASSGGAASNSFGTWDGFSGTGYTLS